MVMPETKSIYCFFISGSWGENANRDRLESLAQELVCLGHEVVILLDHNQTDLVNTLQNPHVYIWPSYRPTKLRDAFFLYKLIKQYRPDCMISQFGSVNIMLLVGWLCRVPLRLARYETKSQQISIDSKISKYRLAFLRLRKRLVFSLATLLLANSDSTRKDLVNVYHIDQDKIQIFYNYLIDPLNNKMVTGSYISNRIICVGRINKSKGQDVLIKALALLPPSLDLKVEFVGSGDFMKDCRELADRLGVSNRCKFNGSVTHSQVYEKFAQAAVSVVPSLDEAFGYVCIESMAVGTPVLGSRVGGIPEIVRDKVDGFLFTAGDPNDLAQKIKLFFSAENDQKQMRANARKRFLTTFEQKNVLKDQVSWLLSELASK